MKRIWFSVIFILIAIGVCTYEQITVNAYYKDITQTIELAIESENEDEKIKYCKEVSEKWDKFFRKITLVTDHSVVQSADVSVGTLEKLADKRDDSVDDALIETKSELDQIFDASKITFSNIF